MPKKPKEEIVVENTICIEDVKFTIMWDMGIVDLNIPRTGYFYNQNYTTPIHSHNHYEMTYSVNNLEIIYEDETQLYEPGTLVVVPPGKNHVQRRGPCAVRGVNSCLQFCMQKLPVTSDVPLFDILTKILDNTYAQKCPKRALEIISSLDSDSDKNISDDKISVSLAFHELVSIIIKSASDKYEINPNKKISDSNSTRAYKIHMIISNNFIDDITIEYVAKKLGLSTRQITRIIKTVYGKTFKELIIERRMKLAAKLLLTTDKNITEIASSVGYNASKGFYNAFKGYYGCLPTEYRKANKRL